LTRSTAQRLGDVTLVLTAFVALSLVARTWAASDIARGHATTFWSYAAATVSGVLLPAFGAACASCWMDDARRGYARWILIAVFAVSALGIVGDVFFGNRTLAPGGRGADLMQDAASLLLIAGGFTLAAGIGPTRDEPREV
jgi:hypothetical protein